MVPHHNEMKEELTKEITISGWDMGEEFSRCLSKETLTHWGRPKSAVHGSGYGLVNYQEWCEKERWRVNTRARADIVKLVTRHGGPMDGWIALKR